MPQNIVDVRDFLSKAKREDAKCKWLLSSLYTFRRSDQAEQQQRQVQAEMQSLSLYFDREGQVQGW